MVVWELVSSVFLLSFFYWIMFTLCVFQLQVVICRNEAEKCLIETSINSLRISLKVNSGKLHILFFSTSDFIGNAHTVLALWKTKLS